MKSSLVRAGIRGQEIATFTSFDFAKERGREIRLLFLASVQAMIREIKPISGQVFTAVVYRKRWIDCYTYLSTK